MGWRRWGVGRRQGGGGEQKVGEKWEGRRIGGKGEGRGGKRGKMGEGTGEEPVVNEGRVPTPPVLSRLEQQRQLACTPVLDPAVTHLVFLWPTTLLLGFGFQLSYLVENTGEEQAAGWRGAQKCQHWINARWTPALTPTVVGAGACSPLNVSCPPGSILSKSGHMTQAPEELQ